MENLDDSVKKALNEFKHTISLCNPSYQAYKNDWKTHNIMDEEILQCEKQKKKKLNTNDIHSEDSIVNDDEVRELLDINDAPSSKEHQIIPVKKIPRAKKTNMDGILYGLPGQTMPNKSRSNEEYYHDSQMQKMNRQKDIIHFRRRDKYSEYVEARARFSKMHSVN